MAPGDVREAGHLLSEFQPDAQLLKGFQQLYAQRQVDKVRWGRRTRHHESLVCPGKDRPLSRRPAPQVSPERLRVAVVGEGTSRVQHPPEPSATGS